MRRTERKLLVLKTSRQRAAQLPQMFDKGFNVRLLPKVIDQCLPFSRQSAVRVHHDHGTTGVQQFSRTRNGGRTGAKNTVERARQAAPRQRSDQSLCLLQNHRNATALSLPYWPYKRSRRTDRGSAPGSRYFLEVRQNTGERASLDLGLAASARAGEVSCCTGGGPPIVRSGPQPDCRFFSGSMLRRQRVGRMTARMTVGGTARRGDWCSTTQRNL